MRDPEATLDGRYGPRERLCLAGQCQYILAVIEHATRRIHILAPRHAPLRRGSPKLALTVCLAPVGRLGLAQLSSELSIAGAWRGPGGWPESAQQNGRLDQHIQQ